LNRRLELLHRHRDVLDDATVEHRGRHPGIAALALGLPELPQDDALEAGEPIARVGSRAVVVGVVDARVYPSVAGVAADKIVHHDQRVVSGPGGASHV
jgi:hypothetical protein